MDLYNIWLSMVIGANPSNGGDIVKSGAKPSELYENRKAWHSYGCFSARQMEKAMEVSLTAAKTVWEKHNEKGIMSVNYTDEDITVTVASAKGMKLYTDYSAEGAVVENEQITVPALGAVALVEEK